MPDISKLPTLKPKPKVQPASNHKGSKVVPVSGVIDMPGSKGTKPGVPGTTAGYLAAAKGIAGDNGPPPGAHKKGPNLSDSDDEEDKKKNTGPPKKVVVAPAPAPKPKPKPKPQPAVGGGALPVGLNIKTNNSGSPGVKKRGPGAPPPGGKRPGPPPPRKKAGPPPPRKTGIPGANSAAGKGVTVAGKSSSPAGVGVKTAGGPPSMNNKPGPPPMGKKPGPPPPKKT